MILLPLLITLSLASGTVPPRIEYILRVDSTAWDGVAVEVRIREAPAAVVIAAHAHPEYDDRYWRHVEKFTATDTRGNPVAVTRTDSVRWRLDNRAGTVTVRYRVRFPREESPRSSWRPFLSPTGGLVGGPHSFLYPVGLETRSAAVTLEMPGDWSVGTGLGRSAMPRTYVAADLHELMEGPMLVGRLSRWDFTAGRAAHRIFYWRLPDAVPFDTTAFAGAVERLAREAVALFGGVPYREYSFLFQDGAYSGGLEHPNSVTLGAPSADLARDPHDGLQEVAHEFVHTWNLMAIKPVEYRKVDYRVQRPVAGLWFSEGLTIYYADLLLRRAGLPTGDSTRLRHLAQLAGRYLNAPGNARFSAEEVSRVAYNASPAALGDYTASSHLQGELLGTLLDFRIRAATDGRRSMDDVMRLMFRRFRTRGFVGSDVRRAADEVCSCRTADIFDRHVTGRNAIAFEEHLSQMGLRMHVEWKPALDDQDRPYRDLRIWGWQDDGAGPLRLRITDPGSIWGRAGLHTGDTLVSVNGRPVTTWPELRAFLAPFAIGDTAVVVVRRSGVESSARVTMAGHLAPIVTIDTIAGATPRQRRLREAWVAGR